MGIPAPSFNYDALNAQGGLGQGLAALTGSLANAAAKRQQAEALMRQNDVQRQGLERLRSNDVIGQENAKRQGLEQVRQFNEKQGLERDRYDMQGLEALARQGQQGMEADSRMGVDKARIENLNADTYRKQHPNPASQAKDPRVIPPSVWNQLDTSANQETDAEINRQKLSPEYAAEVAASKGTFGMFKGPAPRNLDQIRVQLLQANRERRGLTQHQPWMDAPGAIPANAAPAAAGDLRKRVMGAYGTNIPPDVAARLKDAEDGDGDAVKDLEDALSGGATVAPDEDPTNLLGP